ncbi:hypothetical protein HDV00_003491 [Rhizophlyctis rosea]|nr:hypothetical protein HDV00_003491 [Rhizophlyctis rosea]
MDSPWYFPILPSHKLDAGWQVIISIILSISLIEYILYISFFLYCLIRAFPSQPAGGRILVPIIAFIFIVFRIMSLPILVAHIPFPGVKDSKKLGFGLPTSVVQVSMWATGLGYLLVVVLQVCVVVAKEAVRVWKWIFGRDSVGGGGEGGNKGLLTVPLVVVVVPVFNELPQTLLGTIDSIMQSKHPKPRLHVILAFDDDSLSPLYIHTMRNVGYAPALDEKEDGYLINPENYPPTIDITYRDTNLTICRFPHGGKRQTQSRAFEVAETRHANKDRFAQPNLPTTTPPHRSSTLTRPQDYLFLFLDSDVTITPQTIPTFTQNFISTPHRTSLTGLILCHPTPSILSTLQETEYIHSQLLTRSLEDVSGGLTCLPGALTMMRCSTLREVAPLYFGHLRERGRVVDMDVFEYARFYLGEDRYLTHLVMCGGEGKGGRRRGRVGFEMGAVCETVAVEGWGSLVKQRRRWFLGTVANQVCLLITPRLWHHTPILLFTTLLQASLVSISLLQYIFLISLIMEESHAWVVLLGFLVPLCLNWFCMLLFAIRLRRWKVILYPLLWILGPVLQCVVTFYAVGTCRRRTWGGPRVRIGPGVAEGVRRRWSGGFGGQVVDEIVMMYSEDYNKEVYISTRHPTALNMVELAQNRPPSSASFNFSLPTASTSTSASPTSSTATTRTTTSPSHLSIPPPSLNARSTSTQLSPRTPKSPEADVDEWWDRANASTPVRTEMGIGDCLGRSVASGSGSGSGAGRDVSSKHRSSSAWSDLFKDLMGDFGRGGGVESVDEEGEEEIDEGDLGRKRV